jgi:DNA-binding SARP family transcriptional activator
MSSIKVSLFGKFNIVSSEKRECMIRARKVQELFVYLLMFRNHPQPRESLSEVLWADQPATASRKNLRQTLWHLQSALKKTKNSSRLEVFIDDGWIHIRLPNDFWLDTAQLEQVFNAVNHKRARELSEEDFKTMQNAVGLYKGDLLEGWYQDWCIFERERFQMMHLMLLDKLVQYCEIHQKYDAGLAYGWQILRYDQAYERAHRQIMRLYFMVGDRTQALHQYERCVGALRDELGVDPSERTKQLYEQIRLDTFRPPRFAPEKVSARVDEIAPALDDVLNRLEQFALTLRRMEVQVQQEIVALENVLSDPGKQSPGQS